MRKFAWPIVILLLALLIQLGLFVYGLRGIAGGRFDRRGTTIFNEIGPTAAALPMPAESAPGQPPWPPARQVQIERLNVFADRIGTWHADTAGHSSHQMIVTRVGRPWSMVHRVQRWWPWDDPAWASTTGKEAADETVILWHAMAINTAATAALLAIPAAFLRLARATRAAKRQRAGLCTSCGYDLAGLAMCPECGLAASDGKPAHSTATPSPVP